MSSYFIFSSAFTFGKSNLGLTISALSASGRKCNLGFNSDTWTSLTNQTCGVPSGLNGLAVCSNASAALTNSCWTKRETILPKILNLSRKLYSNLIHLRLNVECTQSRLSLVYQRLGVAAILRHHQASTVARFVERYQLFTHQTSLLIYL